MGQNLVKAHRQSWAHFLEHLIGQTEYFAGIPEVEFRNFPYSKQNVACVFWQQLDEKNKLSIAVLIEAETIID